MDRTNLPSYREFMLPTLRAVAKLGGSARTSEITGELITALGITDEMLTLRYNDRDKVIVIDRMDWGRSYAKLGGALDSPKRGLFLLTAFGREIVTLPDADAVARCMEIDRIVRENRRRGKRAEAAEPDPDAATGDDTVDEDQSDESWKAQLLHRLHCLSPTGFEEFVIYLLRTFGMELTRVGGSGDEGIDGIGLAPISEVLSSRVAVQAKRYEPSTSISRDAVALFQRDASAAGAERAVFVTLGRFTEPARKAATVATPTVNLIDGDRLCELVRQQEIGIKILPVVDHAWFDRFDV